MAASSGHLHTIDRLATFDVRLNVSLASAKARADRTVPASVLARADEVIELRRCPLLAQRAHARVDCKCPLLGKADIPATEVASSPFRRNSFFRICESLPGSRINRCTLVQLDQSRQSVLTYSECWGPCWKRGTASFRLSFSGRFGADRAAVRCGCNAGAQFAADSHQQPRRSARALASRFDESRGNTKSHHSAGTCTRHGV